MAKSLAHKFGQIIGELLELALEPHLQKFAKEHKLFFDKKGMRVARKGKKLSWTDFNQNAHDLDFVLERSGTNSSLGTPAAFIEIAWRKSTRHSRNKAQEIQGAILPLVETFKNSNPFIGVVLAGEFTSNALRQLESCGFSVLYFPSETVFKAFQKFDIDAYSDDYTSEKEYKKKIESWNKLPNKTDVAKELLRLNKRQAVLFFQSLKNSISRFIERIIILPLHGQESNSTTVTEAIYFLEKYSENIPKLSLVKYEIIIKYNTGDKIEASFKDKKDSITFLKNFISEK